MADLFDRLFPEDPAEDNIPIHYFYAAMVDYAAGETTEQQIVTYWGLDSEAQADLSALCDQVDGLSTKTNKLIWAAELHAVLNIAEGGMKYTTKSTFKTRLGLS